MKKLVWAFIVFALVAIGLLASRILCPNPQHWLDNLLYVTHLKKLEPATDFTSESFQVQEPADYTPYEPKICEVHHVEMRAEVVPIQYGLPGWAITTKDGSTLAPTSDPPRKLRAEQFPHAQHSAGGGCVVTDMSPQTARIRICSDCELAEQPWRTEHPLKE